MMPEALSNIFLCDGRALCR